MSGDADASAHDALTWPLLDDAWAACVVEEIVRDGARASETTTVTDLLEDPLEAFRSECPARTGELLVEPELDEDPSTWIDARLRVNQPTPSIDTDVELVEFYLQPPPAEIVTPVVALVRVPARPLQRLSPAIRYGVAASWWTSLVSAGGLLVLGMTLVEFVEFGQRGMPTSTISGTPIVASALTTPLASPAFTVSHEDAQPPRQELVPARKEMAPAAPKEPVPAPRELAFARRELGPAPRGVALPPRELAPAPRGVAPPPRELASAPRELAPAPREPAPAPREPAPAPTTVAKKAPENVGAISGQDISQRQPVSQAPVFSVSAPVVQREPAAGPGPTKPEATRVAAVEATAIDHSVPLAPSPLSPVSVTAARADSREAIQHVLDEYQRSYDRLDASSAAMIWRGVDSRALARAFSTLSSQDLSFDQCDVNIYGARATALCHGELRYVRRVGAPTPHVLHLSWAIDLERSADHWVIANVKAH